MRALITGGAGYIGSHLLLTLLEAGHDVVVVDDFSNGHAEAVRRAQALAGRRCDLHEADIADEARMRKALEGVDVVFHLAAFKSVDESVARPARYFRNNLGGLAALIHAMEAQGVRRIVYSSTAAVYSPTAEIPLAEDAPTAPASPYGWTKLQGESMLETMARHAGWSAVSLRYFNPVGAHPSGRIGEHGRKPANLFPRVLMALTGDLPAVTIFGTDYDTDDGTCLRDYIHVCDLARAHVLALAAIERPGHAVYNVGTGRPYSVREVIAACGRAAGRPVPVVEGPRRAGDMPVCVADPRRFREATGFAAEHDLDDMVASAWRWWRGNPGGYG
ncbi:MAG: UDP-glucose 4-epimerase GalE [Deltaproteobacteria bacterium]|nr:MAG: UDP-glucose 4-epimerase GalE [Deltaproteobacteria bacterium]